MIENKIYSIDKIRNIDGAFYKNVAGTAANAGEFGWALDFIEKFKSKLEPDVMENYYHHALMEYYLKLKDFDLAKKYLAKLKHTNYVDKLNIKRWEIITSYELKQFEELRYILDSSKHFIQNDNKISGLKMKKFSNFVQAAGRLLSLREMDLSENRIYEAEKFNKELEGLDISHKAWLKESVNSLLKP